MRHLERLRQIRPRVLASQLGGAAGTLASLCKDGLAVRAAMTKDLGLVEPDITWHVSRDGLTKAVLLCGLVTASLAKVDGHDADDGHRVRRDLRAVPARARLQPHDAAETQPDLVGAHDRGLQDHAPALCLDVRRDGAELRAPPVPSMRNGWPSRKASSPPRRARCSRG